LIGAFARRALEAERLTPAGRINLLGLFGVFLIISGSAILDLAQPVGRLWDPAYDAGGPSLVLLLVVFGVLLLLCVVIVGLLDDSTR
jgi:hypothetical protein